MNISFSRFSTGIDKDALVISPEPTRLIVSREPLKNAELPLKGDCLYFGKVSEMPAPETVVRTNLLLLKDEDIHPSLLERNWTNMVLVNTEEAFEQHCKAMRSVFEIQMQVNVFANQLLNLVQDEAKIEELLDLGHQALGNPLLVFDTSLCLLYNSGAEHVDGDPVIEYALSKGYMPEEYLEAIMKEESEAPEDDKVLIFWEKDFLKNRLVAGRILRGNRLMAYLKLFESNRPIDEVLDVEILRVLCQYLALSMETNLATRQPGTPFIETFLLDIIERKLVDPVIIQDRVAMHNLDLRDNMIAIIVEMEERYRKTDKLYLLKRMLQNLFKRNTVFIHGTDIIIVYDHDALDPFDDKERMDAFAKLLKTHSCRAAVSMPFKDLCDLHSYYHQAVSCLQISDRIKSSNRIVRYEDQVHTHMLLLFGEAFSLRDLVPPSVWELGRIDDEKGSSLTKTLFCYVKHRQDVTSAAKAMHVHYNTLKYRISRICEATGIDLDNPDVVFQIMLAEQALNLLNRIEGNEAYVSDYVCE